MNRASQQALLQSTNQQLISIRQLELDYYVSLNTAFGTQAALIGGFVYSVFTQNNINYSTPGVLISTRIYWVLSAICLAFAVHVILCTMLLQIYGPGLALNGPVGSMARAAEGLRVELNQIITSFIAMMIFFALSTLMSFWMLMSVRSAAISSFIFIVAARYWYYYCERIFLRFYWDPAKSGWQDRTSSRSASFDPADMISTTKDNTNGGATKNTFESARKKTEKKMRFPLLNWVYEYGRSSADTPRVDSRPPRAGTELSDRARRGAQLNIPNNIPAVGVESSDSNASKKQQQQQQHQQYLQQQQSTNMNDLRAAMASTRETAKGVQMEGYLTMRGMTKELRRQPWRRRYFTLTSSGQLFCYKSRQEYRADPKAPVFTRPFLLSDHFVRVDNMDEESRSNAAGAGAFDDFDNFTELDGGASELDGPTAGAFAAAGAMPMRASMTIPRLDGTAADTSTAAGGAAGAAVEKKMKPYRFQIALAPRENEELQQGNTNQHRNWIVLRCDTEEELLIWVGVMQEISPSSFGKF